MKKTIVATILMVLMCCVLWGCGKSEAVKNVEALIDGIGEVTVDSEESIEQAEEAYNALTDEEKAKVENADQLITKREELDAYIAKKKEEQRKKKEEEKKAKLAPYVGTWKSLYGPIVLNDYYRQIKWTEKEKVLRYDIVIDELDEQVKVNDDGTISGFKDSNEARNSQTFKLIDDNGIAKLVSRDGVYVRSEDYDELIEKMFVHVTLDEDNIEDYIGGPVEIGKYIDEWGDETDTKAYTFSSPAYDNEDLIMLAFKGVKFEIYYRGISDSSTYEIPYPLLSASGSGTVNLDHFGRAEGEIWYIRKEYVSDIEKGGVGEAARNITFTDGFKCEFYVPSTANTNITTADYEF